MKQKGGKKKSQKRKKGIPLFCGQSNFLMVEKIRKRKKKKASQGTVVGPVCAFANVTINHTRTLSTVKK